MLLLPAAALVGLTGHYGGAIVHGPEYIDDPLPMFMRGALPPYPTVADQQPDVVLPADPATKVDFWRDIDPIFKKSCYECHDAKEQKGDLRMDNRAALLKGGEDGPGFIAGDGRKSAIVTRSLGEGEGARMPKKKTPLSANQIELIKRWIDQGAEWPAKP
jgi:mono/diheme cytochrome c family protein